jgi:hypothetical protein
MCATIAFIYTIAVVHAATLPFTHMDKPVSMLGGIFWQSSDESTTAEGFQTKNLDMQRLLPYNPKKCIENGLYGGFKHLNYLDYYFPKVLYI